MSGEEQTAARQIRVVLVDDQPIVRKGLALLLGMEPDLVVCGEAEGEAEAFRRISRLKPDLAVVDLELKEGIGLDLIKRTRVRCAEVKLVVFSMHHEEHFVTRALAAGAHGYVTKEEGTEELVDAIRLVMSGNFYLSRQLAAMTKGLVSGAALRDVRRHR